MAEKFVPPKGRQTIRKGGSLTGATRADVAADETMGIRVQAKHDVSEIGSSVLGGR